MVRRGRTLAWALALAPVVALAAPAGVASAAGAPVTVDVLLEHADGSLSVEEVTAPTASAVEGAVEDAADAAGAAEVVETAPATTYRLAALDPGLADPVVNPLRFNRAQAAWGTATGTGTVVAVLDTGVRASHEDLRGALLPAIDTTGQPADPAEFHGTLVSSVVAARAGNGRGAAGVAPGASVLPVRVCVQEGCPSAAIANGILRAVATLDDGVPGNDVAVVSMSLGGGYSSVIASAVDTALARGIVVVASAGNGGASRTDPRENPSGSANQDNAVQYPAALPGVVSVSATETDESASWWATHNPQVALSALGNGVLGAGVGSDSAYVLGTGTSFSAPQVAGAAALVKQVWPTATPAQVRDVLVRTARRPAGWSTGTGYGSGTLDAAAAVAAAATAARPTPTPTPTTPAPTPSTPTVTPRADGSADYTRDGRTVNVRGAILARYRAAGGHTGPLGWPTSGEVAVPGGASTTFERGQVWWTPAGGAQVVVGEVLAQWQRLGAHVSPVGFPVGEERGVRGGVVQAFQRGIIAWSPATGAREVRGAILDRVNASGGVQGFLGFPTTGEVALRGGAFTAFQGGSVYWSPATGAQVVRGEIRRAWGATGWENGRLGYPRTGEFPVPGGVRQDFQGGSMTFSFATRAVSASWR
ncbi:S8 family serine peptidase [Kineococcus terrestris]|uniref:S8 family serine peptidase n=1 Tax=Kineococcus terrestris TaxID=2044856 RepID=UPI0034DAFCDB